MGNSVLRKMKCAERELVSLTVLGEWHIDDEGRIWRSHVRRNANVYPCERRRVEKELPSGYLMVRASIGGVRHNGLAHRLVWQHFNGDIATGMVINHKNGRKGDNRPENLEVISYSENSKHCHENLNPRVLRGSDNGASKLTESDVYDMRVARAGGASLSELADQYGVAFQYVSKVCKGRRWAHVRGAPLAFSDGRLFVSMPRNRANGRFVAPTCDAPVIILPSDVVIP